LTLLKTRKIKNIILICIGISIIVLVVLLSDSSCGIKHILIINALQSYEKSLDPEFCEELVEQIDSYNEQCMPQVEILDCG
jgi:hypothetical protein